MKSCCTRIEVSAFVCCTERGEPTVSVVEPPVEPKAALIVDVPTAIPLAKPELFRVAVAVFVEFHVAEFVRSCIVPSLYTPSAASCCVAPGAIAGVAGVTARETSEGFAVERAVRLNVRNWRGAATDQICVDGSCTWTGAIVAGEDVRPVTSSKAL